MSGYTGCDAIEESSTENNIIHSGQNIHYSGKYFINPVLSTSENKGNGYAVIEYFGENYE